MFRRSLIFVLVIAFFFAVVSGQVQDAPKPEGEAKPAGSAVAGKLRDIPFTAGVDLQFLIKVLARDLDVNVLFDPESFRSPGRKVFIELKNVTTAAALDYVFAQEGLIFEEVGPKTILVASRFRGMSIQQIGVGITPLTDQLAQYFGVDSGILISMVRDNSPASKAGLKAGDVIVEIDGVPIKGTLALFNVIKDKKESAALLKIARDRKSQTISITPTKGVESVLNH